MRKNLILPAIVLAIVSCSKSELDVPQMSSAATKLSVPVTIEPQVIEDDGVITKSFLGLYSDGWKIDFEDGDNIGFFQFRRGILTNQGTGEVEKSPSDCVVNYPVSDFKAGDAIFSYLVLPEGEADLAADGIVNDNPRNYYFKIPELQITNSNPETFDWTEDHSFEISNVSISRLSNPTVKGVDSAEGLVPNGGIVSFKIVGYDRDLLYVCGGDASDLTIDPYGNASVYVSFAAFGPMTNNKSTVASEIRISLADYPDTYATIPVSVTGTYSGYNILGIIDTRKVAVQYSKGTPSGASVVLSCSVVGDAKPYPVRNCVPLASKQLSLTSSHILYPETIQASMTMYTLGSLVEFKPYSSNPNIAVGETLYGVEFASNQPCAGACICNLIAGDLALTNMTSNIVTSIDENGLTVNQGKNNYVSLYMALAPGTYDGVLTFITDQNLYIFDISSKEYKRNVKKGITVDLANASAIVPIGDVNTDDPGEDSGEEEDEL